MPTLNGEVRGELLPTCPRRGALLQEAVMRHRPAEVARGDRARRNVGYVRQRTDTAGATHHPDFLRGGSLPLNPARNGSNELCGSNVRAPCPASGEQRHNRPRVRAHWHAAGPSTGAACGVTRMDSACATHQVLHRSLPGRHPYHRQWHHPGERTRRRPTLRPGAHAHATLAAPAGTGQQCGLIPSRANRAPSTSLRTRLTC